MWLIIMMGLQDCEIVWPIIMRGLWDCVANYYGGIEGLCG